MYRLSWRACVCELLTQSCCAVDLHHEGDLLHRTAKASILFPEQVLKIRTVDRIPIPPAPDASVQLHGVITEPGWIAGSLVTGFFA